MKEETKQFLDNFHALTHVMPVSARLGVGSMRGLVYFKIHKTDEVLKFINIDNFYREGRRNFNGLNITFLEDCSDDDSALFIVEISDIKSSLEEKIKTGKYL